MSLKDITWNSDVLVYIAIDKSVRERSKLAKKKVVLFEILDKIIYIFLSLFDEPCFFSVVFKNLLLTRFPTRIRCFSFVTFADVLLLFSVISFSFYWPET